MAHGVPNRSTLSDARIAEILAALDKLFGLHPGFRPVHAKGIMCSGTFVPTEQAKTLTKARHANRAWTPVCVRFSNAAGIPLSADNDPAQGSPRGMAVRWELGAHEHTDIVTHSFDGFPTHTAEEFLEFLNAVLSSGPDAAKPTPIEKFLGAHPAAAAFVLTPKPIPTSFAHETFFGVNAFLFTNAKGEQKYGRVRVRPHANSFYHSPEEAAKQDKDFLVNELDERLKKGAVRYQVKVQIAEAGDNHSDATAHWPEGRQELDFGTITLEKRVDDQAADFKRVIFDPVPRVEGIDPSDDPLIEVRAAIYLLSGRRRRAAGETK